MGSPDHRVASVQRSLAAFVEDLYLAEDFEDAFDVFQSEVNSLGFDGVFYTYIPMAFVESNFVLQPFYKISDNYRLSEVSHNSDSSFHEYEPLVESANDDIAIPIDWWKTLCEACKNADRETNETTDTNESYGTQDCIIIPLLSDSGGLAGASFIRNKNEQFYQLTQGDLATLKLRTHLFHNLIISNTSFKSKFMRPWTDSFSNMQLNYLRGLAAGKKTGEIAAELGTTSGYLEQTMLKLRRKLSGAEDDETPTITRSQILYHAGSMNMLEYDAIEQCG